MCSIYSSCMNGFVRASIGFAADQRGAGVAYVRIAGAGAGHLLRVGFSATRYPGLDGREVSYAALAAVVTTLRRNGIRSVQLEFDEAALRRDIEERRDVPAPLTVPYVRLRCALNALGQYRLAQPAAGDNDLAVRAQREITMHAAA